LVASFEAIVAAQFIRVACATRCWCLADCAFFSRIPERRRAPSRAAARERSRPASRVRSRPAARARSMQAARAGGGLAALLALAAECGCFMVETTWPGRRPSQWRLARSPLCPAIRACRVRWPEKWEVKNLFSKNQVQSRPFPRVVVTPGGAWTNTGNVRATSLGPRTDPHRTILLLSQCEGGPQGPADLYFQEQKRASWTSHRQLRCTCRALSGYSRDVLWLVHLVTACPTT